MFRIPRTLSAVLAVLGVCAAAGPASAGWLTIKNDTKSVIVIQETGGPLNRPIRGKLIKLQPGETYREYHLLPGEKKVVITEAEGEARPLVTDKLTWQKDDATFAVTSDGPVVKLMSGTKPAPKK